VCPGCACHYPLSGEAWVDLLLDPGSWQELDANLVSADPLSFIDSKRYSERLQSAMRSTGLNDAVMAGTGRLQGRPVHFGTFLFRFMGGSMGAVVGEKIARLL